MKSLLSVIFSGTLLASASVIAAKPGDLEAGREKSQTCVACHGADGNSENPIYPIIANQYRDYLAQALTDYRSGLRNNAIMRGFAGGLSDQDILDLALYFSQQPSPLATPAPE